jgi:hypothetical protein
VTQGTAILHLFPGVAQVKFFWVFNFFAAGCIAQWKVFTPKKILLEPLREKDAI